MTDAEKALIAWACNEIRDLDEVCRSMIPGYEPLESGDMQKLRALEGMVEGVPVVESCREEKKALLETQKAYNRLYAFLRKIHKTAETGLDS